MQRSSIRRRGRDWPSGRPLVAMAAGNRRTPPRPRPTSAAPRQRGTAPTGSERGGGEVVQCGYAPSDITDGELAGFAGTTPAGELTPDFFARLCGVDPELEDLNYAAEAYDAVIVIALAVGDRRHRRHRARERDQRRHQGRHEVHDLRRVHGPHRRGRRTSTTTAPPGRSSSTATASRSMASYGLFTMGDNNRIDPALTEYISVEGEPAYPEDGRWRATREGDGVLTIGSILPQTGIAGVPRTTRVRRLRPRRSRRSTRRAACSASDVVGITGDSGDTTTDQADQTVDRTARPRTSTRSSARRRPA